MGLDLPSEQLGDSLDKLESLKQIIEEARSVSPEFNEKYSYWYEKRKKITSHDWLLNQLTKALGEARMRDHLESLID